MKFRTHIVLALTTTALVPFLAWTYFQTKDVAAQMAAADEEQAKAGRAVVWLIEDRIRTIGHLAEFAARAVETAPKDEYEKILAEVVEGFPLLDNLHVDRITEDAATVISYYPPFSRTGQHLLGSDHNNRWHVAAERGGETVMTVFSPVLLSSQVTDQPREILTFGLSVQNPVSERDPLTGHTPPGVSYLLSGAISITELLADVVATLQNRGYEIDILTNDAQVLWPISNDQIKTWPKVPESGEVFGLGSAARYATTIKLSSPAPDWTVVVSRPQTERMEDTQTLHLRALEIGLLVILLSALVAYLTGRPITRALRKMTMDLETDKFGSDDTTVKKGPYELQEFQTVYRRVKVALDERNEELRNVLEKRSRQLHAEEMLFRAVFEGMSFPCLLLDADWHVQLTNTEGEKLRSDVVDGLIRVARNHPKTPHAFLAAFRTKDGRRLTYGMRVLPFAARRSTLSRGYAIMAEDVTERENLARMKRDLISIVAHELKTPVTACKLQVERLIDTYGTRPEYDDLSEDLDHLSRIVSDWLKIGRIDAGSFAVSPEVIQLDPIIRRARRIVAAKREFDFSLDLPEDAECIRADPSALTEVFVNLMKNSCKSAKPGEKPRIEVRVTRLAPGRNAAGEPDPADEGDVVIEVVDHGIGIAPENLEKIFDRFYQVTRGNKRKTGGTGLGLVITRAVCEAHGGTIKASSGNGTTTMTIRLPQKVRASDQEDLRREAEDPSVDPAKDLKSAPGSDGRTESGGDADNDSAAIEPSPTMGGTELPVFTDPSVESNDASTDPNGAGSAR